MIKKYFSIALLLIVSLQGCKKEMMDYEGLEGVYFAVQHGTAFGNELVWPYQPDTDVEFAKISGDETTVSIKVMITGPVKDYDRHFRVEINPDSTTAVEGVHFEPIAGTVVIPADSVRAYVPVTLKRTPDLKEETKVIGLRLLPNEDFQLSFPHWDALPGYTSGPVTAEFDASLHSIRVSDMMVQPAVWVGSVQEGNRESGQWGAFSQEKMELMLSLMDELTYDDFSSSATMPTVLTGLIRDVCSRYLVEQYEAGHPVLEKDGRLMFFGNVPWLSYVGVPYVPGT